MLELNKNEEFVREYGNYYLIKIKCPYNRLNNKKYHIS